MVEQQLPSDFVAVTWADGRVDSVAIRPGWQDRHLLGEVLAAVVEAISAATSPSTATIPLNPRGERYTWQDMMGLRLRLKEYNLQRRRSREQQHRPTVSETNHGPLTLNWYGNRLIGITAEPRWGVNPSAQAVSDALTEALHGVGAPNEPSEQLRAAQSALEGFVGA